jgi:prephenate dehydratase
MSEGARPLSPAAGTAGSRVRVAFQGELGAFSDEAIARRWNGSATPVPSISFEHVVAGVADGSADYGILPVWNTIVGDIEPGCAAVDAGRNGPHRLIVIGEAHVDVRHQLLGLPGSILRDITAVSSHPVALAQCRRFLSAQPRIVATAGYDTAGAARDVASQKNPHAAAIASHLAAQRYGLIVLQADIQDAPINVTHFLVLGRPKSSRTMTATGMARF